MSDSGLIKLGGNLESPRECKATDFPNVGASGPEGQASGAGQLVKLTENQEGPRHVRDSGGNTPSDWGKDYGMSVAKSKGEGGMPSVSVASKCSVDLETGQTVPNAEIPDCP